VTKSLFSHPISLNCPYPYTALKARHVTYQTGNAGTGKSICHPGGKTINLISGRNCGKQYKVDDMDGYISFLMYPPNLLLFWVYGEG